MIQMIEKKALDGNSVKLTFLGKTLMFVNRSATIENSVGVLLTFGKDEEPETLTAKWFGLAFCDFESCFCGKFKLKDELQCNSCKHQGREPA